MNICYLDFWPGFDIKSNWFDLLFRDYFNDKDLNFIENPNEADIIVASVFGNARFQHKNSKAIKIFYTGENSRAEFDFADYTLSFDFDSHGGKNFRLPHWYLYVNWWNEPDFSHAQISLDQLNKIWEPEEVWNREKFCSIMIGNPVPNRIHVANLLNNINQVDPYGRVFDRPYDGDKVKLLENYRFNICFENSITEGYVTEKFLQAKVAGCIPIYYGHSSFGDDFNTNCAVDYTKTKNDNDFVNEIYNLNTNKEDFIKKASEPLFNKPPSLDSLFNFMRNSIKL